MPCPSVYTTRRGIRLARQASVYISSFGCCTGQNHCNYCVNQESARGEKVACMHPLMFTLQGGILVGVYGERLVYTKTHWDCGRWSSHATVTNAATHPRKRAVLFERRTPSLLMDCLPGCCDHPGSCRRQRTSHLAALMRDAILKKIQRPAAEPVTWCARGGACQIAVTAPDRAAASLLLESGNGCRNAAVNCLHKATGTGESCEERYPTV